MAVDPNNKHPSFSKLLEQGFINKIRMPAAFVKEHKKMLAKTCLLKTDEGLSWEAKIVREASGYFACEGDWPRFVLHHKLELGDMLIFFLVDKFTFHVLPYSKKPRTNIRHFEELSSSDEDEAPGEGEAEVENAVENEEQDTGIGPSRRSKKVKTEPKESSAPGIKKANEVKMEPVILSDSEEETVDPSCGSKARGYPCYLPPGFIMKGGKSDAKADDMLGVKKKAPETKEAKKVFSELIELSDSEEESIDPSCGSKDGGNPYYAHPGVKSNTKADNMLGVKKKALETKEAINAAKDPDKPKRPARSFYVKQGRRSARDPDKPKKPSGAFFIFMTDFRKQIKEENPKNKSAVCTAGGEKWKQLSDAEKAPYMADAKKRMEEYHRNKDAYNKRVAAGASEEEES